MISIPLEDNFTDIVGKAQRGLKLETADLADKAGISVEAIEAVKNGEPDEAVLRAIAGPLGLGADALVAVAKGAWIPAEVEVPGLAAFNTPFEDMTVNSYLAWDRESMKAVAFDTGADCSDMLEFLHAQGLKLELILLTHTHGDHIFDIDRLREKTGAPAWVGDREPLEGVQTFAPGKTFQVGDLTISTRLTWGHSKGGITYVIEGLGTPVAVVGDAVFAGSMGGGAISYADALETNRKEIFTLPADAVLCPGHGPLTTVGEQLQHNPFFAKA